MKKGLLKLQVVGFLVFFISCATATKNPETQTLHNDLTASSQVESCEEFETATWENTTLYDLTSCSTVVGTFFEIFVNIPNKISKS